MAFEARVFQIMLASPADVETEREAARNILYEWNVTNAESQKICLIPTGWDSHSWPQMGNRPQEIINSQVLNKADALVVIFWNRLGTPSGEFESGTVEEIEKAIARRLPVMVYFSNAPVNPNSINMEQRSRLLAFKRSVESARRGLFYNYGTLDEFKSSLSRHINLMIQNELDEKFPIQKYENIINIREPIQFIKFDLSKEAQTLLREASNDPNGQILFVDYLNGESIQTNGKRFIEEGNPRSSAVWQEALNDLESNGFIKSVGYKRQIFTVTAKGFEMADKLRENIP